MRESVPLYVPSLYNSLVMQCTPKGRGQDRTLAPTIGGGGLKEPLDLADPSLLAMPSTDITNIWLKHNNLPSPQTSWLSLRVRRRTDP